MHAIFPFIRVTHTKKGDARNSKEGLEINLALIGDEGIDWKGSKSGGGTASLAILWKRVAREGGADICITRAPTRYRRVFKPAFPRLMYTFHVAANCTGRRKDSRASARRYYVTCRSIMIPPLR